uniref:Uncharacterized protein n=1 Tax=Anguilla anguilla TaxID=7936 RepID=A0A0E9PW45_ANGAN
MPKAVLSDSEASSMRKDVQHSQTNRPHMPH